MVQEDIVLDAADAAELERLKSVVPQLIRLLPDALRDRSDARQNAALSEMLSNLLLRFDSIKIQHGVGSAFFFTSQNSSEYNAISCRCSLRLIRDWWMRRRGCDIFTVRRMIGLSVLCQPWRSGIVVFATIEAATINRSRKGPLLTIDLIYTVGE